MQDDNRALMVVGHKNPDTDSICSAMVYARYKREIAGVPADAYRAGNLNEQTQFALRHFDAQPPPLLTDVYPRVRDIMIGENRLITVRPSDCLEEARRVILENGFAFLPVTDDEGRCLGKVTALRMTGLPGAITDIAAGSQTAFDVHHFAAVTGARNGSVLPPKSFTGRVVQLRAGSRGGRRKEPDDVALVVEETPGWEDAVGALAGSGAKIVLAIVYGARMRAKTVPDAPKLPILFVDSDLVSVITAVCLSMPVSACLDPPGPTFSPSDLVRSVQREVNKYNEGGFLVVDEGNRLCGVVTRVNFFDQTRFRIIMVDHNEFSQAVDGMEHAEVVEVIDHHRIGTRTTDSPITFINKVVGSSATIVAEMYRNAGREPDRQAAGLLLSALLSDTVILRSPTATSLDREIAPWLAELAGVAIDSYGEEMFSAGSSLATRKPAEVVARDQKFYDEGARRFSVSQIEVVGFKAFSEVRESLRRALEDFVRESGCDFGCLMVTDITEETTLLLCAGEQRITGAITYPHAGEATYEMKGVLSRKKQVVPYLVDVVRNL